MADGSTLKDKVTHILSEILGLERQCGVAAEDSALHRIRDYMTAGPSGRQRFGRALRHRQRQLQAEKRSGGVSLGHAAANKAPPAPAPVPVPAPAPMQKAKSPPVKKRGKSPPPTDSSGHVRSRPPRG